MVFRIMKSRMKIFGFISLIVMVSLAAIGCGGDDGGEPSASATTVNPGTTVVESSISKADYQEQANGICEASLARMRREWARYLHRASGRYSADLFAEASKNVFIAGIQFWVDDISVLGAPEGDEETVETILKAIQLGVVEGEKRPVTSPERLAALFADANYLARRYGLDGCFVGKHSFTA
jgi:hypothetical protein